MVPVVICTHGALADALLSTGRDVFGDLEGVAALCMSPDKPFAALEAEMRAVLAKTTPEEGALILTDVFGGTPFNVCQRLSQEFRVEVLTGVNLPMLLKALEVRALQGEQVGMAQLAELAFEAGARNIRRLTPVAA